MSDKPSAAWYLAPIFMGIIGSAIMWFVLKDEDHPDSPKMVKKGWIIGIALTVLMFAWIPLVMIPIAMSGGFEQQHMQPQIPVPIERMIEPPVPAVVPQPVEELRSQTINCYGRSNCFVGYVTRIIDGDTITVDGKSIRFALSSTPELDESGGAEARQFIEKICPVGSVATVDEDDGQLEGSYGRIVGMILCNGVNLNEAVLEEGLGYLSSGFCDTSEFSSYSWAQKHGC